MGKRTRRTVLLAIAVIGIVALFVSLQSTDWLSSFGGELTGARLERARHFEFFHDGRFHNLEPTSLSTGSYSEMLRHQFFGAERRTPLHVIPIVTRHRSDYATPPRSGLRATWIGWASVLVEIDGRTVLTDPIWSDRCSPSTLIGPKRFHAPPIALAELPPIDVVVISHDHFDHLDMMSIRALAARGTRFVVPLGVGAHLERWGVTRSQVTELVWDESTEVGGLRITSTPARHYSGRSPLVSDRTLWCSWVVKGPRHRFFFSGDSGYSEAFRKIGIVHGPFDLTLIKIGAYDPTWAQVHMTPEEAVQVHRDVRGRLLLPVHWGTFNLAFHAWREPADRVLAAARRANISLVVPRPGEWVEPGTNAPIEEWWNSAR